jgi:hypothetical protein
MKLLTTFKLSLIALMLFSITSCQKKEQETTVTENDVPQAVLQVFNQVFPGALVKEYTEEIEDGQKFYEISFEFEGRKIDAIYKQDGNVAAIEEIITAEELPDIIHQAIAKEIPQFSIQLAEKIEKEGKQFFEVKLLNAKNQKKYELLFAGDGKLVEKEKVGEYKKEE